MALAPQKGKPKKGVEFMEDDDVQSEAPPPPPPNKFIKYSPNFYTHYAPHWQEFFKNVPTFGTPMPMVHPNIPTPTPEQLMARYFPVITYLEIISIYYYYLISTLRVAFTMATLTTIN